LSKGGEYPEAVDIKGAERSGTQRYEEPKERSVRKSDGLKRDRHTRQRGFDFSGNELVVVGGDERDESEDRGVLVVSGADKRLGKRV
jgi:hypothetical protein